MSSMQPYTKLLRFVKKDFLPGVPADVFTLNDSYVTIGQSNARKYVMVPTGYYTPAGFRIQETSIMRMNPRFEVAVVQFREREVVDHLSEIVLPITTYCNARTVNGGETDTVEVRNYTVLHGPTWPTVAYWKCVSETDALRKYELYRTGDDKHLATFRHTPGEAFAEVSVYITEQQHEETTYIESIMIAVIAFLA